MSSTHKRIDLHPSWLAYLEPEFAQSYMQELKAFLLAEKQAGKVLYPASKQIFNAFNSTPLEQVRVVVLGQDPYHARGQAQRLWVSVQPGVPTPPAVGNIAKELQRDLGCVPAQHGYLPSWAEQCALLLNATLRVEQARAGSHRQRGWERFTDRAIQ